MQHDLHFGQRGSLCEPRSSPSLPHSAFKNGKKRRGHNTLTCTRVSSLYPGFSGEVANAMRPWRAQGACSIVLAHISRARFVTPTERISFRQPAVRAGICKWNRFPFATGCDKPRANAVGGDVAALIKSERVIPLQFRLEVRLASSSIDILTWKCAGSSLPCRTRLQSATELLSSVHSVSSGSLFTLLQNGWIDLPRADRRSIQSMQDLRRRRRRSAF